jgi:uncharacterized protein (TIGR01777 family)
MSDVSLRVAVTGASGLIGSALVERLAEEGHQVLRMVRRPPRGAGEARWDPDAEHFDAGALNGVDAVVHLAGESVVGRWTAEKKAAIRRSRIHSTRILADGLARLADPPRVLACASAVGYYGDRGDEAMHEGSSAGGGFLAGVVSEWEAAAGPATRAGIRVANLRFGVVLSARGGALAQMLPAFRLGAGGRIGSGRQWMSWISLDDAVGATMLVLRDDRVSGPVNVVAGAVPNADFTRVLGGVLHRPAVVPVPTFALKLAYGAEMVGDTLLASQRAEPRRLRESGYRFAHPELEAALRAALAEE